MRVAIRNGAVFGLCVLACLLCALGVAGCGSGGKLDMAAEQKALAQVVQEGERLIAAEIDLRANLPTFHDQLGTVLPMVLRNVLFGANNVYDILMLYDAAEGFERSPRDAVIRHMHDRMGIVLQSNQEDLRLLRNSKELVLDPNVLLHINYLIEYTRKVNGIIAEAMLKTGGYLETG